MKNKERMLDMENEESHDNEDNEDNEDYELLYKELGEYNTIADVVDLIEQQGMPFVLSSILRMMDERGHL